MLVRRITNTLSAGFQFGFPLLHDLRRFTRTKQCLKQQFNYDDSFHCECRAYGRLKEANLDQMVVPCHGYVFLTPDQEKAFRTRSTYLPWPLIRRPEYADTPVRGIIKEWVREGTPNFTAGMVPGMKRDIAAMHLAGVINRDIGRASYMGGKLVDFGIAVTVPHYKIDYCKEVIARGKERVEGRRQELEYLRDIDGDRFDSMIEEWNGSGRGPQIWERYFPNSRYSDLRHRHEISRDNSVRAPNPVDYDWKGAKKAGGINTRNSTKGGR